MQAPHRRLTGFVTSALAIWFGARRAWNDMVNTGIVFLMLFRYTKLFDRWWDIMPKWLFFLVVALAAILVLRVLRRPCGRGLPA
ncbi:MAG TPA: hypothetical protein PKJ44_09610 [Thauera aminoaromatica]|nr:hypothetical protein [Thauera aminoaromatica]